AQAPTADDTGNFNAKYYKMCHKIRDAPFTKVKKTLQCCAGLFPLPDWARRVAIQTEHKAHEAEA
ncbi:MAG: hypothetical protein Q4D38_15140, partial [Planctomycetia bacterium]|nr:hypothetical protein [Planctomycetia bacterium]